MSQALLFDHETGKQVKEVAKISIVIVTSDEALNDRMDEAICKALDGLMTAETCYDIAIEWKHPCPVCSSANTVLTDVDTLNPHGGGPVHHFCNDCCARYGYEYDKEGRIWAQCPSCNSLDIEHVTIESVPGAGAGPSFYRCECGCEFGGDYPVEGIKQ